MKLLQFIQHGWLSNINESLAPYHRCRDELTLEAGCLVRGFRIVIPAALQQTVLGDFHGVHVGVVGRKGVARSFSWWHGIYKDIKRLAVGCPQCQELSNAPNKDTPHPWIHPSEPFERVHIDFAEFQGQHYLLVIDAFSKLPEIYQLTNTTTQRTIDCLLHFIAIFGIPKTLVSGNGPQFTSELFRQFCAENGIRHTCTYHPFSNGQVERLVQDWRKAFRSNPDSVSMKTQMYRFLSSYRNTPHTTSRVTPSSLVYKKLPNTKFSLLKPSFGEAPRQCQDSSSETKRNFEPEETVLILNTRNGTESRCREGTVMQRLGPFSYVARCGEQNRHVHSDHMPLLGCSSTSEADPAVVRSSSVFDTPIVASNCTSIRSPTGVE